VREKTSQPDTIRSGHSSVATISGMDQATCTTSSQVALVLGLLALTLLGQNTSMPCFTSVCSTPYLVTPLASLHLVSTCAIPLQIQRPVAALFSFTSASFSNGNIIIDLRLSNTHIFSGTQLWRKTTTWCKPLLNFRFNSLWPALLYFANPPPHPLPHFLVDYQF